MLFETYWNYRDYIKYASINNLEKRYKNMYLGVLWIFLDPLLFVAVLYFVNILIFDRASEEFVVYLMIGMVAWRLFSSSLVQGSGSLHSRMGIIEQIPVPKQIFPLIDLITQLLVFAITFILVFAFMLIYGIPFSWHIIEIIPITFVFIIFLYGISLIMAHYGTMIADFKQGLVYVTWLLFFLTPIYYDYSTLPDNIQRLLLINPVTTFIESYRDVLMYDSSPNYNYLGIFLLIGILLIWAGLWLLKTYDKKYVMMK